MTLAIGIDPRIRARRIAVRRAEGRRRLRFLGVAVGLVALALGGWAISRSPLLDLDHVRLEGVASDRAAEVDRAMGIEPGTPLIELDLGGIEAALTALPWVERAEVTREWPGTLRVDVGPRVPVALVDSAAGPMLLDAGGVVIEAAAGRNDLPHLALRSDLAPGEVAQAALPALAVVDAMPGDLRPWVEHVTIDGQAGDTPQVGLDLVGDAHVTLGSVDHLADKLTALRAFLAGVDLACVRAIDVTVADLPVARRDPVCDTSAAPAPAG